VKDKFTTLGSFNIFAIAGPVGEGKIKLTTPAGTPARSNISIIAKAVRGVSPAGFRITVHPAASAGPIFLVAIAAGKFQGVIKRETPIGCFVTIILLSPLGEVLNSPLILTASSENHLKNSAAYKTSP
jgi:hypothetical protein